MDGLTLQFTPFLMPIIGAAIVLSLLAAYAARRIQTAPGSDVFFVLLLLSAWWCYTYALELITTDPAIMLFWVKLEWISIALLPVAWLFLLSRMRVIRIVLICRPSRSCRLCRPS